MDGTQNSLTQLLQDTLNELAIALMVDGMDAVTPETLDELASMADRHDALTPFAEKARALRAEFDSSNSACPATAVQVLQQLLEPDLGTPPGALRAPAQSPEQVAADEDLEMLSGFISEAEEHLSAIEENILSLEKNPEQLEPVHSVFRGFHTLKGVAGFLGLDRIQAVAHDVETLLDHARNGRLTLSSPHVDAILESAEYLRREVAIVQARLDRQPAPPATNPAALLDRIRRFIPNLTTQQVADSAPVPVTNPVTHLQTEPPAPPQPAELALRQPKHGAASSSVRIDTSKLDFLMDVVGEMVIAQSMLAHNPYIIGNHDARLAGDLSHLARITGEVQRRVMGMRMMPIGPLFQKNAKLVRDISRRQGKEVELELVGENTELDKVIAEELSDPLLHMIRNAIDHGIETPAERIACGKSPRAKLRLSAEHQSGQIVIGISDDGRGLDPEKILKKAIQKGLASEGAELSEDAIFHLIFEPGFSTAESVTDLSGRGVGMDVVRSHVENLRGAIQICSELGKGTTFLVHLPLTLAIIEGLVIIVGENRYIIPIFSVREILRPTADMVFTVQGREETVLMRGHLLPLVRLHRRFNLRPRSENVCDGLLVICESAGKQFALFVDDLVGRQEIVIKSLGSMFEDTSGLAGCAILGDGRIGLILDVGSIYRMTNRIEGRAAA